jgi:hypothetical protein
VKSSMLLPAELQILKLRMCYVDVCCTLYVYILTYMEHLVYTVLVPSVVMDALLSWMVFGVTSSSTYLHAFGCWRYGFL